jgi:hypothetical protein
MASRCFTRNIGGQMTTLDTFLADLVRGQQAVYDATAWVEYEHDPKVPGRTGYRITGKTPEIVQSAIDGRMAQAERTGRMAEFTHPRRGADGQFVSLGHIRPMPVTP